MGTKSHARPVFVNKICGEEHSHTHLFIYYPWLLLFHSDGLVEYQQRLDGLQSLKYIPCGPLQERFAGPCSRELNTKVLCANHWKSGPYAQRWQRQRKKIASKRQNPEGAEVHVPNSSHPLGWRCFAEGCGLHRGKQQGFS